ncbi:hypothetical protein DNTS_005470 [Danionella cerebrum]|uniref:UBC core domain-containing protein n=1 Tax=Danionella cerebrum TaxID=2873325 RepID=A0A553MUF1_9TELE|nr:hypothetical protein DNTS_005470 [Danionella translucida]TRY56800.1 hypothetical protein DNTS_005470 [Danionella translucida]
MNPFWTMSTNAGRKRSDSEEHIVSGEQRASPVRPSFGKKQLPSIPKNAIPITKASSPAASPQSANGTHASYGPFYLEYSLLAEFTLVIKQKLPGIYVQPSYRSALMWFGVIFIRHGLYQDGVFKFTVYIPDNYPDGDCPRVVFDTPVFHPLVDPVSGELDVRRAFTKWRRNHNHIWQVLMYARTIFYKINTMEPLNPEAAVLRAPQALGMDLSFLELPQALAHGLGWSDWNCLGDWYRNWLRNPHSTRHGNCTMTTSGAVTGNTKDAVMKAPQDCHRKPLRCCDGTTSGTGTRATSGTDTSQAMSPCVMEI